MLVLVVGAGGTIGRAVVEALRVDHDVTEASRSGARRIDITDPASIGELYEETGPLDAVVCTAGVTPFKPLTDLERQDFVAGLDDKLLGQLELVRQGVPYVRDGGSFTLMSGITSEDPIPSGTVAGMVSGAMPSSGVPRSRCLVASGSMR